MILGYKGGAGVGKTAAMVGKCIELTTGASGFNYEPSEVVANFKLTNMPGYICLNNQGIRNYLKAMIQQGLRHKIIMLDEIDRVYVARFFGDRKQTEELVGLWQDEKLFNHILYTEHMGDCTDKIIRDSTKCWVYPEIDKENDLIIANAFYEDGIPDNFEHCWTYKFSHVITQYDRWQIIK